MATLNGRNARVTVKPSGTEQIVMEIGSWSIDLGADEIDTTSFGSGWAKSDVGMKKWSGSLEGFSDPSDDDGQGVIEEAFLSGALVGHIRFYEKYAATGEVVYWTPDITTDASAGARITAFNVSQDKAGVASLSVSFSGSGPLKRVVETVSP